MVTPVAGLTMIAGGEYTIYRVMAEDAVDAALHSSGPGAPTCVTDRVTVIGGEGFAALWNTRHRLAERSGLHVARIEHLLRRYGNLVDEVLDLVAADPDLGLPLEGAPDHLRVEAHYAASHEGALHLDDVLARHPRMSIETFDRGTGAAPEVARIVAAVLGWDEDEVDREFRHYDARVSAERESQEQPDDQTADAARMGAADVRTGMSKTGLAGFLNGSKAGVLLGGIAIVLRLVSTAIASVQVADTGYAPLL